MFRITVKWPLGGPRRAPGTCSRCGAAGYPLGWRRRCVDRWGCAVRQIQHLAALGIIQSPDPPAAPGSGEARPRFSGPPAAERSVTVDHWRSMAVSRSKHSGRSRRRRPQ